MDVKNLDLAVELKRTLDKLESALDTLSKFNPVEMGIKL